MIVKPCTAPEVAFYETALQHPGFARWMPTFFGTLNLSGQGEGQGEGAAAAAAVTAAATAATAAVVDGKPAHDRLSSLVLQNAAYGFEKPCVLDVKLGARLWDDDAPQQKRARLDAVSDQTTSRSLGMRVAGMKVWKGAGAGHRTYDKLYGRSFTADSVGDALGEFFASEISADQTALVAARFLEKVRMVRQQLESQESRMYSASLLFVYEGDGKALARAVEARKAKDEQRDGHHDSDNDEDRDGDNDEDGLSKPAVCVRGRWQGSGACRRRAQGLGRAMGRASRWRRRRR